MIVLDTNNKIITPGCTVAYYCKRECEQVLARVISIRETLYETREASSHIATKLTVDPCGRYGKRTLSRTVFKEGGYIVFDQVEVI